MIRWDTRVAEAMLAEVTINCDALECQCPSQREKWECALGVSPERVAHAAMKELRDGFWLANNSSYDLAAEALDEELK